MKTLEQWNESGLDLNKFLKKGDEIDWYLFEHIVCGYVASNYDDGTYAQCGEAYTSKGNTFYYETVKQESRNPDVFRYIGLRADMNKYKPKSK